MGGRCLADRRWGWLVTGDLFGDPLAPAIAAQLARGNALVDAVDGRWAAGQSRDAANEDVRGYYPTHPAATFALLAQEQFTGAIWECACGEGHLTGALEAVGHQVVSTDLFHHGFGQGGVDFLAFQGSTLAPNIVTNPPFKEAHQFIVKALALAGEQGGKVAMYLRLGALGGIKRGKLFRATPLARVHVLSRRVKIQRGRLATDDDAGGMVDFAWFVWDTQADPADDPTVHFVDWKDAVAKLSVDLEPGA